MEITVCYALFMRYFSNMNSKLKARLLWKVSELCVGKLNTVSGT